MICVADISDLWKTPLEGCVVYVVKDYTSVPDWWNECCRSLGMKKWRYFNSGLLFIGTASYVQNDIGSKAIALVWLKTYSILF